MDNNLFILKQKTKYEKISLLIAALGGIIIGFCVPVSVFLILGEENEEMGVFLLKFSIIGFFILIAGMVVHNKAEKFKYVYKEEFFSDLVPKALEDVFDSVVYNYKVGFTNQLIINIDLFGLPMISPHGSNRNISSWNYLCANYKGIFFKCSDVSIYSGEHYLFYGRLLEIDYPLSIPVNLKIYSRNFTDVRWELFPGKSGKIQTTENQFFNDEFQVRCDNEKCFEKIITPQMIEKLELFHNIYDQFAIAFYDDKLYVALDRKALYYISVMKRVTDMRYESYEPDYSRGTDYQYQINKIKRDTKFITDAIDIFCRDLR